MIVGKYKNLEFWIWKADGFFRWQWSHYGAETSTLGECYAGIRRASSEWSKVGGVWSFSQDPI